MLDFLKTWLGRILGTILGISGAGLFGAMAGFAIGAIIDKLHRDGFFIWDSDSGESEPADFILSSMILAASVAKADGKFDLKESEHILHFLKEQYGAEKAHEYYKIFERTVKQEWDIRKITQQLRIIQNYDTRLQLLYFLFGLANTDNILEEKEVATLKIISIHLGISAGDYDTIKAMYMSDIDSYFKMLEIKPTATESEIKEAFRKQANKYHPDKIGALEPAVTQVASEKFQKLQFAYEQLKLSRNIK